MSLSFVFSVFIPLLGAVCCIRVFPLSMRKFTTIITLWMYLLGCGYIAQAIPIALSAILGELPAPLHLWVEHTSAQVVAIVLCSIGVGVGMLLIPLSYWMSVKLRGTSRNPSEFPDPEDK